MTTKAEIVNAVHERIGGFSKKEAADLVDLVFETMKETLGRGEKIKISGFGNFVLRDKHSRQGRNPQTGDPLTEGRHIGPVVNKAQWDKIQRLIRTGIDEGAALEAGGPDRPEGADTGYYVRPTLFSNVANSMTIAREEIFGPVVTIIPYEDDEDAIRIANDTDYGLSAVVSGDPAKAKAFVPRLRAGMVYVNAGNPDPNVPFGGYKQSGNGREYGKYGLAEFMEVKSVIGAL